MPVLVTDWVNRNEILQSVVVVPGMRQKKTNLFQKQE